MDFYRQLATRHSTPALIRMTIRIREFLTEFLPCGISCLGEVLRSPNAFYLFASCSRGVARSKNVGWTTDGASKGGLETEPPARSRALGRGSRSMKQKAFWCLYIHRSGQTSSLLDRPLPHPRKKTRQICINSRNAFRQKWGGPVHPVQPVATTLGAMLHSPCGPLVYSTLAKSSSHPQVTTPAVGKY